MGGSNSDDHDGCVTIAIAIHRRRQIEHTTQNKEPFTRRGGGGALPPSSPQPTVYDTFSRQFGGKWSQEWRRAEISILAPFASSGSIFFPSHECGENEERKGRAFIAPTPTQPSVFGTFFLDLLVGQAGGGGNQEDIVFRKMACFHPFPSLGLASDPTKSRLRRCRVRPLLTAGRHAIQTRSEKKECEKRERETPLLFPFLRDPNGKSLGSR